MRTASSIEETKTLPSPILPELAAARITSTICSARASCANISSFSLGRKSTVYSAPRYTSVWPFWRPWPLTSETVIPSTPMLMSASFTASSLLGWMIASIFFMMISILDSVSSPERQNSSNVCSVYDILGIAQESEFWQIQAHFFDLPRDPHRLHRIHRFKDDESGAECPGRADQSTHHLDEKLLGIAVEQSGHAPPRLPKIIRGAHAVPSSTVGAIGKQSKADGAQ